MQIGNETRNWMPTYSYEKQTPTGRTKKYYHVRDAMINECPKSAILQDGGWAMELVNQLLRSERLERDFGETNFGQNVHEWPAWAEDVVSVFKKQQKAIERAREEDIARFSGR